MTFHKIVYIAAGCMLLLATVAEYGAAQQAQNRRSIPRLELNPDKYRLNLPAEKIAQNDSARTDSAAAAGQETGRPSKLRRHFAKLQIPLLDASPKQNSASIVSTSESSVEVDSMVGLSAQAVQDSLLTLSVSNLSVEELAATIPDSANTVKTTSHEVEHQNRPTIPWDAIASVSQQETNAASEDSANTHSSADLNILDRFASMLPPAFMQDAMISFSTIGLLFALVFFVPAVRMRFYFVLGLYPAAIRTCEKIATKKPNHHTINNMMVYACFSGDTDAEKANKAFEKQQTLLNKTRNTQIGSRGAQNRQTEEKADEVDKNAVATV